MAGQVGDARQEKGRYDLRVLDGKRGSREARYCVHTVKDGCQIRRTTDFFLFGQ